MPWTGSILSTDFIRGHSKLVHSGMVHLGLQAEHYGSAVIPEVKISDLLSRSPRHREERVVSHPTDREYLDVLWVMAVLAAKSENNFQLYYQLGELVGFTATTVSIKRDGCIFVVDDRGASLYYRNI